MRQNKCAYNGFQMPKVLRNIPDHGVVYINIHINPDSVQGGILQRRWQGGLMSLQAREPFLQVSGGLSHLVTTSHTKLIILCNKFVITRIILSMSSPESRSSDIMMIEGVCCVDVRH